MKTRIALVLVLLLGALGLRYWDKVLDESMLFVLGNSTIYSSGYSEGQFDKVEVGDSFQEVSKALGAPFEQSQFQNDRGNTVQAVEYSKSDEDSHYRIRTIFFIDNRVSEKVRAVHID